MPRPSKRQAEESAMVWVVDSSGLVTAPQSPPGSVGRVREHLSTPLYRNAYLLIIGAVLGSAFGFLFWILAAHRYSPEIVGRNSAAIAAMVVVSGISQLGLNAIVVRYVP